MLSIVQIIEFELGEGCNLHHVHPQCPNRHPDRWPPGDQSPPMDDQQIVECAEAAYNWHGFTGLIGFIYYNEPLLQKERMFRLMETIESVVPTARFILWTNGYFIEDDCERYRQFEQIVISGYSETSRRGALRLARRKIEFRYANYPQLDGRLEKLEPQYPLQPCRRPFVELIFDARGNMHWCCYAWRYNETYGSIHDTPFDDLVERWHNTLPKIVGRRMEDGAPECCLGCGFRWNRIQVHDIEIVRRAEAYEREAKKEQKV